MVSAIATLAAVPLGLMSAIYLSEYAGRKFRAVAKPLLEILAGIPTVVYGFFAASTAARASSSTTIESAEYFPGIGAATAASTLGYVHGLEKSAGDPISHPPPPAAPCAPFRG